MNTVSKRHTGGVILFGLASLALVINSLEQKPMVGSILKVPGLDTTSDEFRKYLMLMCHRNAWNVDGIAAVISHESRFDPTKHNPNPKSTAVGLIQFINSTAKSLGTTSDELRSMSALEQLLYVERYFQKYMRRKPSRPEDYLLVPYGRIDLIGKPDTTVVDSGKSPDIREQQRYEWNSGLDRTHKGFITVGDIRHSLKVVLDAAQGERIPVEW